MSSHDFYQIASQAAEIGAQILNTAHPRSVMHKGDRDLVTDVDLRIEHNITSYLAATTPGIELLGEETSPHATGPGNAGASLGT